MSRLLVGFLGGTLVLSSCSESYSTWRPNTGLNEDSAAPLVASDLPSFSRAFEAAQALEATFNQCYTVGTEVHFDGATSAMLNYRHPTSIELPADKFKLDFLFMCISVGFRATMSCYASCPPLGSSRAQGCLELMRTVGVVPECFVGWSWEEIQAASNTYATQSRSRRE